MTAPTTQLEAQRTIAATTKQRAGFIPANTAVSLNWIRSYIPLWGDPTLMHVWEAHAVGIHNKPVKEYVTQFALKEFVQIVSETA